MNVDKTTTVMPAKAGIRKRVCASHDSCAADAARPDPRLRGGDGLFVYVQCETALERFHIERGQLKKRHAALVAASMDAGINPAWRSFVQST